MGLGAILVDFSGWTSAHGIPHVGSANNLCLRMFWAIIFLGSTCMFIFQMVLLVDKYTAYDVTVQTELKFEDRTFPAVTVCNLNPYKRSTAITILEINDLMDDYQAAIAETLSVTKQQYWGFNGTKANDTITLQSKAKENLMYIAGAQTNTTLESITYGRSEFIMNCAYNTKPCKMNTDFTERYDPVFGKCFTFNSGAVLYNSTRAGPLYGLRILAVSRQNEYLPITESAGIRVAVHGQTEEPFADAFGYNAAAGFTTSFGIKFIKTERLPAPYGNCTVGVNDKDYYYDGEYSVEGCFRSCFQRNVLARCECGDARFRLDPATAKTYCRLGTQKNCAINMANPDTSNFNPVTECACRQPCTESTYGVTVSTALWPSEVYRPPRCELSFTDNNPNCVKWYNENTMLVEVYYERMNYQMLSESEAYTLVNLISDMGGQLGLWMGVSVITMVEFISLLIILCLYGCSKANDQKQDPNGEDPEAEDSPPPYDKSEDMYNHGGDSDTPEHLPQVT